MVATVKAGAARVPRKLHLSHTNCPLNTVPDSALGLADSGDEMEDEVEELGRFTPSDNVDKPGELCPGLAKFIWRTGAKRNQPTEWGAWLNELHHSLHDAGRNQDNCWYGRSGVRRQCVGRP